MRSWWMLALRGAIAILFGILALLWPGLTLLFLVAMFAAFAVLSGAVAIVGAPQGDDAAFAAQTVNQRLGDAMADRHVVGA